MRAATSHSPSILSTRFIVIAVSWLLASCGGGGGGESIEQVIVKGLVVEDGASGCIVCVDLNRNGRCDDNETQVHADEAGSYQLSIPKGSTAPLLAELAVATKPPRALPVGTKADRLYYRLASPSAAYSTNLTPYTTLVYLVDEPDLALAEALVRNSLGLPPRFDLALDGSRPSSSLRHTVADAVMAALEAAGEPSAGPSARAFDRVVGALPPSLTTIPTLVISTKNAAPIDSKEIYVDATFVLTNPAAATTTYTLNGKIRGRGNSTWNRPKNPYKVQFKDDANLAALPDVLGMRRIRNWVLLADYFDRSLLRNKLAFSLGNSPVFNDGLKWTPSMQHVEVTLNGDYVGVYLLGEDIRVDPARLDIHPISANAAAGEVDGGYIVEVDDRLDCYNGGDINLQHVTPYGVRTCIKTPDETAITPAQQAYIKTLQDDVERDIFVARRMDKINATSFVDWYLLNEVFRNHDAQFYSSVYLWKDAASAANPADRLVNLGPIWDFDLSAGNVNFDDGWKADGCWVNKAYTPNWLAGLFDNPQFLELTLARWKAKRPALEKFINASIDTYSRRIDAAQARNFVRWQLFGEPLTNYYVFANYTEEVAFLKQFLNQRMAWLDRAFTDAASFNAMCK